MGEQPKFTDYADYLHLDTLLATQHPLSDHPDELHFIIVHQVHELWFKLALHHLERARDALLADSILEAIRLINQVGMIFSNARATVEHLHSLPPASFHVFRGLLAPGSGMQSYQFRELELLAGRRDERFLKWVGNTLGKPEHWQSIKGRLEQTSVIEAFIALLERHQIPDLATLYDQPDDHLEIFMLADALSSMEHLIVSWRQSHVQLIERTIGKGTQGTGGTMHDYLQAMLNVRLFGDLWSARDELSRRVDERIKSQRAK